MFRSGAHDGKGQRCYKTLNAFRAQAKIRAFPAQDEAVSVFHMQQVACLARNAEGCCSTSHLVAFVHLSGDDAKKWTARGALVQRHISISQALLNHIHDLGHNVANVRVL
jgi:hypothetical protein